MTNISICADDFGYSDKSDRTSEKYFSQFKTVSVLPNLRPLNRTKASLLKKTGVALHINLIEGKPCRRRKYNTLTDKKGRFYPLPLLFLKTLFGKIDTGEIEAEIDDQINYLKDNNLRINELNSHQHLHALEPYSGIIIKLAKKYSISKIRSYSAVRRFTVKAKITHFILKLMAGASALFNGHKLNLPATWKLKNQGQDAYMSWEGGHLDFSRVYNKGIRLNIIVHPGLPFDSNKSYYKILSPDEK